MKFFLIRVAYDFSRKLMTLKNMIALRFELDKTFWLQTEIREFWYRIEKSFKEFSGKLWHEYQLPDRICHAKIKNGLKLYSYKIMEEKLGTASDFWIGCTVTASLASVFFRWEFLWYFWIFK